jgi:ABC-type microcin C transport system permease subunit YejE
MLLWAHSFLTSKDTVSPRATPSALCVIVLLFTLALCLRTVCATKPLKMETNDGTYDSTTTSTTFDLRVRSPCGKRTSKSDFVAYNQPLSASYCGTYFLMIQPTKTRKTLYLFHDAHDYEAVTLIELLQDTKEAYVWSPRESYIMCVSFNDFFETPHDA